LDGWEQARRIVRFGIFCIRWGKIGSWRLFRDWILDEE